MPLTFSLGLLQTATGSRMHRGSPRAHAGLGWSECQCDTLAAAIMHTAASVQNMYRLSTSAFGIDPELSEQVCLI